jgi:threonine/homoserine/homoserine lactone efflux protein
MASAMAFAVVKYAGAAYLVWIGIGMIRSRHVGFATTVTAPDHSFCQGIIIEVLNPKTAPFFLSFIP